jgi:hypothetical protein
MKGREALFSKQTRAAYRVGNCGRCGNELTGGRLPRTMAADWRKEERAAASALSKDRRLALSTYTTLDAKRGGTQLETNAIG